MIMVCPKCSGCGKVTVDPGPSTSVAPYITTCNSCWGVGYVTDNVTLPEVKIRIVNNTPYIVDNGSPPV